jgi:hypothetical protein
MPPKTHIKKTLFTSSSHKNTAKAPTNPPATPTTTPAVCIAAAPVDTADADADAFVVP